VNQIKTLTLVCFSFFLAVFSLHGQTKFIQGYVMDENSGDPLPFAHIVLENTGFGTVSNREGYFRYNLPENINFPVKVSVSFVGYANMHMKIDDTRPRIFNLKPEDAVLSEIVVEADFVIELLENTFNKIPENYPDDDSRYKGFYRQTIYKHDTVVYMGEAFIDSYKSSYKRPVMDSQIEILKFRKFTSLPNYEDSIKFYGGVFNTYLADYVKLKAHFLNPRFFDKFDYTYEKKISYAGEMNYKIDFEHTETDAGGTILINENGLAITNIYFETIDSVYTESFFRGFSSANVNYAKLDGKYYLNNYDIKIHYVNILTGEKFVFNAVYAVSEAFLNDASPIPYRKTAKYRDIFMDSPVDTSSTFWENYNIIEDDTQIKSFTSKYEPDPPAVKANLLRNLPGLLENFSFQVGAGNTWTSNYLYPNELIAYEHSDSETEKARYVYDDKPVNNLLFSMSYNITRLLSVNYNFAMNFFSKDSYIGHELSCLYKARIKHYGNPMFIDGGLGFSSFTYKKHPEFEKRSQTYPFIFRSEDIYYAGIEGRAYFLEAQLTYFPERFIGVALSAKLAYIAEYSWFYKHNEDRIHDHTYRAFNIHHENIFFKDRLKPSVSIGIRFHPFGAF